MFLIDSLASYDEAVDHTDTNPNSELDETVAHPLEVLGERVAMVG